jgi:DNA-binding GntR family transcriptional regulator
VSRTPIREALRQLQREELVVVEPNNILRVATISMTDAVQLYDCRLALEQLSVAEACEKATEAQIQNLNMMVMQAEKLINSKPSQLTNYQLLDLDYRFHRLIAESSGNLWLRSLLDQVFDKMMLLRIHTIQNNRDVLEIRTEHRQIYEAVQARNADAATQAIKAHLVASKERVVREMKNLQQTRGIVQEG